MENQNTTPEAGGAHYGSELQPWDLQRHMPTSGDAFVDGRRCDILKYGFRIKGDLNKLKDDMKKVVHCAQAAIDEIESMDAPKTFFPDNEDIRSEESLPVIKS